MRTETSAIAAELDERLLELWSKHDRFVLVPHDASFFRKIQRGLVTLEQFVDGDRAAGRFAAPDA
jgi:hypothetical protein